MSNVKKNQENLKKCKCMKCPSYTFACKMKNMPKNMMGMISGIEKLEHFEGLYCAFEKSKCITNKKGCICSTCDVYKENSLDKLFYCTTTNGE